MDDDDPSVMVKNTKNEKPVAADEPVETEATKPKTVEEDIPTTKTPTPSVVTPKDTEAVKVFRERARTEETVMKQQNADNTALTALQNITKKIHNVFTAFTMFNLFAALTALQNIKKKILNVFTKKDKFEENNMKTLMVEGRKNCSCP